MFLLINELQNAHVYTNNILVFSDSSFTDIENVELLHKAILDHYKINLDKADLFHVIRKRSPTKEILIKELNKLIYSFH